MKTIFLFVFLFSLGNTGNCNVWPYVLTSGTSTYADLQNTVSLNNGNVWNYDSSYNIPVTNFNFSINGIPVDTITAWAGKGLLFNGSDIFTVDLFLFGYATVYGGTLGSLLTSKGQTTSLSPISYKYDLDSVGGKILKVEWKNCGIDPLWTSDTSVYINYQIWLFETDQHIELHYGPNDLNNILIPGPYVSFYCFGDYGIYISGNESAPTEYWCDFTQAFYSPLNSTPSLDRVYYLNLNPLFTGVASTISLVSSNAYPNPFNISCTIRFVNTGNNGIFSLYDSKGRCVRKITGITGNELNIDREELQPGIYFYQAISLDGHQENGKLVIE